MTRFRKKPMIIEAEQYHADKALTSFLREAFCKDSCEYVDRTGQRIRPAHIHTEEGPMIASDGDWVIRGIMGEFYPCKPDIFAATYEPVEGTEG